jgi:phosphoketolase
MKQTSQMNVTDKPLTPELLGKMNACWRAANYLSVGQIYFYDNPLLKEPLKLSHVKPLVVGHWDTTPGQNFIYVHLNRVIKKYDLDMFYIAGPGHGGPALVGNVYLEGTWSEVYPDVIHDEAGLAFSFCPRHLATGFGALAWRGGPRVGGTASSVSSRQIQPGCAPWRIHCRDGKGHARDNKYPATRGSCGIARRNRYLLR